MAFKNHFSPIAPQTIFKEARISNNFKDINIKLNNKIESVNSLILSNALTWLKFTLEDLKDSDKDVVIAAPFEDFSTNCLKSMLDLIHFGYVCHFQLVLRPLIQMRLPKRYLITCKCSSFIAT